MKPELTKSDFPFIEKEYYEDVTVWIGSRECHEYRAKVSKRMKLQEIGSPEIIYTHTRREDRFPVYYAPTDIKKNLDWEELYDAFQDSRKAAALLKDRKLAARLRKEGGTCHFISDFRRSWVILLWVGKNPRQVRRILKKREAELACERALKAIVENAEILAEHGDALGSVILNVVDEGEY